VIAAAAALVGVSGSAARATTGCESGASAVVHLPDGSVQTVSASALCDEADVFDTQYFTRGSDHKVHQSPYIATGTSIHTLLEDLAPAVDPSSVGFVDIQRADATWTTLDPADLADPSDFADDLLPVLVVNGDLIDYYRPLYPDPDDVNAEDAVVSPANGAIDVDVHSGSLLTVNADANRSTAAPGRIVRFDARVSDPPASSQPLSYAWTFGDGATATGADVTHAFTTNGTYDAQVTVTGNDDSGGVSEQIAETIGTAPPKTGHHGHGTGSSHQPHAPSTGPPAGNGTRAGGRPSHHTASGHAATGQPSEPGGGGSRPRVSLRPLPATQLTRNPPGQQPRLASRQAEVHGQLIGPGTVLSAHETSPVHLATAVAAGAGVGRRIGIGAAVSAVLLALLGLGAVRELGWSLPRGRRSERGAQS
jgi:hypothetical protein